MANDLTTLSAKAVQFRGQIIENLSSLELMIDTFLCFYFTKEESNRDELANLVFRTNRITFESKRQIFEYILKNKFPNILVKYPSINKDLIFVIEQRNIIAHYILGNDEEDVFKQDKELTFIKYKNEISKIVYTNKQMVDLKYKILKLSMLIGSFVSLFSTPPSNSDTVHSSEPS